jgi:hypothetical protein
VSGSFYDHGPDTYDGEHDDQYPGSIEDRDDYDPPASPVQAPETSNGSTAPRTDAAPSQAIANPVQFRTDAGLFEPIEREYKEPERPKEHAAQYQLFDNGQADDIQGQGVMFDPGAQAEAPKTGRADYQERQEARRDRLEDRAAKLEQSSEDAFSGARAATAGIPFGQPILVGHYSEKRHRRDIARSDAKMRKGIDDGEAAKAAARQAEGVGSGGISSDDPEAVVKLREKLEGMRGLREAMKARNARARKEKTERPHPAWELTNLGANIRATVKRIDELLATAGDTFERVEGEGFELYLDEEENRVCFELANRERNPELKRNGFKWSRTRERWQRLANANGRNAARYIARTWQKESEAGA